MHSGPNGKTDLLDQMRLRSFGFHTIFEEEKNVTIWKMQMSFVDTLASIPIIQQIGWWDWKEKW